MLYILIHTPSGPAPSMSALLVSSILACPSLILFQIQLNFATKTLALGQGLSPSAFPSLFALRRAPALSLWGDHAEQELHFQFSISEEAWSAGMRTGYAFPL